MTAEPSPFVWSAVHNEAGEVLRYGEPETDNIGLGLDCANGELAFRVWVASPPKGVTETSFPTRLQLWAGRRAFDLPAVGHVTELGDGETVVTATPGDPMAVLKALRAARRLVTETYDGRGRAPAPSGVQLAQLAKACGTDF